jgi:hypothetical protein
MKDNQNLTNTESCLLLVEVLRLIKLITLFLDELGYYMPTCSDEMNNWKLEIKQIIKKIESQLTQQRTDQKLTKKGEL